MLLPTFVRRGHPDWSLRTHFVAQTLRVATQGVTQGRASLELRRTLDRAARWAPSHPLVRRRRERIGGVEGEWFTPRTAHRHRVMLHIHGGGYALCSTVTHRMLLSGLARSSRLPVFGVDYRLAPEHPFPAPVDDCVAAYRGLLARFRAEDIVLSGDSAGGALALATMLRLREAGDPLPGCAILISPWVDLERRGATIDLHAEYDYLRRELLDFFAEQYLQGADPLHPEASPCHADLAGLPTMFVQAGGAELLLSEIRQLAIRARAAGVEVDLEVWDGMIHAWHGFSFLLPEGKAALQRIGAWLAARFAAEDAEKDNVRQIPSATRNRWLADTP